jgi:uncharacterized protein (TIGR04255 family)
MLLIFEQHNNLRQMHYDHAPITEALIDIRIEPPSGFGFEQLQPIKQHLSGDYPHQQELQRGQAQLSIGEEIKAETSQEKWGLRCFSADGKQAVQAQTDGFTFSRLEPYETWEHLRDEAKRLWQIYRDHVKPAGIVRVAIRYLNQINLPGSSADPEVYLNTYPQLASNLPEELRQIGPFSMTLRIPQPDLNGMLVINEALANKQTVKNTVPVILDLDLFVSTPKITDDGSLWDLLERLRERKNIYFEASITDKTRELIR